MRDESPIIELLRDYGVWLERKAIGQGWGGSCDFESLLNDIGRAPGTHSDRVLSEVVATLMDGQGIFQLLNMRISEYRPNDQKMIRLRYQKQLGWQLIADKLAATVAELKGIHARMTANLYNDVRGYILVSRWDFEADSHARSFNVRAA